MFYECDTGDCELYLSVFMSKIHASLYVIIMFAYFIKVSRFCDKSFEISTKKHFAELAIEKWYL
jgi:hypothetical protein